MAMTTTSRAVCLNRISMMPTILYLGHNDTDHTVTFAIGTARYEYFLPNPLAVHTVEYIARISAAKALNRAKRLATRTEKLNG